MYMCMYICVYIYIYIYTTSSLSICLLMDTQVARLESLFIEKDVWGD